MSTVEEKQQWLKEAKQEIEKMSTKEFERFLCKCSKQDNNTHVKQLKK